jgi:putative spermidine/putrescine transport system permease protein
MTVSKPHVDSPAAGRRWHFWGAAPLLLLLPSTILFVTFFVLPLAGLLINSLYGYSRLTGVIYTISTGNYERILTDSYYLSALLRTLRLASLTALLVTLIGYPVAYFMTLTTPRQRGWITLLILSPLLISVIVRTFGWMVIFGPNGFTDWIARLVGLGSGAILYTEAAAVIGLANVLLPFFVLSVVASLQGIDPSVPLAAASLGASPWRVFWRVTIPLSMPGILVGLLIVFSLASSSFVTPALLGGSDSKVLSMLIYQQALGLQNWPFAAALAVVLVATVLLIQMIQIRLAEHGGSKVVVH